MSNHKIQQNALTTATGQRASDLASESRQPTTSCEVACPPQKRSLAAKLETNHSRRSLFGRSVREISPTRRRSTQPRSARTDVQRDELSSLDVRGGGSSSASSSSGGGGGGLLVIIKKGRGRRKNRVESLGHLRHSLLLLPGRKKPDQNDGDDNDDDANLQLNAFRIRPDTRHGPSCNTPREHFKTGKQYYLHLKKSSISPPFGFEHITHTLKEQLPGLNSVDERDLTAKFWAITRTQRPRHSLRGIQADDLPERRLSMALAYAGRSRSASHDSRRRSSTSTTAGHRHSSSTGSGPRKDSATLQPALDGRLRQESSSRSSITNPGRTKHRVSFDVAANIHESQRIPESVSSIQSKRKNRTLPPLPEQSPLFLSMEESWEDDVDFCYEQEAEATCEFDWGVASADLVSAPTTTVNDNRDSVWSTPPMNRSPVSPSYRRSIQPSTPSYDTSSDQPHRRGSSIGHRGFLAARSSNPSLSAAANLPPTFRITPDTADGNGLPSPNMTLVMSGVAPPKSPSTTLNLSTLQPSTLDELSDPESTRTGGSRHRKSSSFGSTSSSGARSVKSAPQPQGRARNNSNTVASASNGSSVQNNAAGKNASSNNNTTTTTTTTTSSSGSSNGNRWSLASFASVPELIYSNHRRNKTSISKMRISAPMETPRSSSLSSPSTGAATTTTAAATGVSQSGNGGRREEPPPTAEFENPRGRVTIHRSQKPGDRATPHAVIGGRAAQRGRALAASARPVTSGKFGAGEEGAEWI